MTTVPDAVASQQRQLLERAQFVYRATPLSAATCAAFLAVPRHGFVRRYRVWGSTAWQEVTPDTLAHHLARLYNDEALVLAGDDDENLLSTISQPSFMLRMLDLLQLAPGQRVFELGAGSGWNAALIAQLVGPTGRVVSLELHPDIARDAQAALQAHGITTAKVVTGDGGEGYAPGAPYDRVIFTAGSYEVPRAFFTQLADGGRLLLVLKQAGGGDYLCLLRRTGDHFVSELLDSCAFLALRGKYQHPELEPQALEECPPYAALRDQECDRTPFWWGGANPRELLWRTLGIRFFLSITEPGYRVFTAKVSAGQDHTRPIFGIADEAAHSLVLAHDDQLITYGTPRARAQLLQRLHEWVDLGMPSAASFTVHVYPRDHAVKPRAQEWLVVREESQFLWTLHRHTAAAMDGTSHGLPRPQTERHT